jgi:hypothetical protein
MMTPQSEAAHEGAGQLTPAPMASHETVAVSAAVVELDTGLGEIVVVTAIGLIGTTALTDFVLSKAEVAVTVTLPPEGSVEGAV